MMFYTFALGTQAPDFTIQDADSQYQCQMFSNDLKNQPTRGCNISHPHVLADFYIFLDIIFSQVVKSQRSNKQI